MNQTTTQTITQTGLTPDQWIIVLGIFCFLIIIGIGVWSYRKISNGGYKINAEF